MKQRKCLVPLIGFVFMSGILCFTGSCKKKNSAAAGTTAEEPVKHPDTLRMLFVGDVIVHSTQYHAAWHEGGDSTYNFSPPFEYIKDYISSADLGFANMEVPFGGKPYSGYPMFSSPSEIADALKEAGFDILFTANNHAADKGKKGLEATIDYLDRLGLIHTGSFKDSTEKAGNYPLIVEANNIRLSILNYTYSTNGMPVYKPNIVNLIDTVEIKADLDAAKKQDTDYIITCIHWGYEYQHKEHAEQRELARFLAENGSDIIIGGHPHVVQPYHEIITTKGDTVPVIYSLGNFISNQQWRRSDGGISFELTLVKTDSLISRLPCSYEPLWVNRFNDHVRSIYRIIPVNDYLRDSAKYALNDSQLQKMKVFYDDTRKVLHNLDFSGYYAEQE